jgi:hypothetical protein
MERQFRAVYENGVLRPKDRLDLQEHEEVSLRVVDPDEGDGLLRAAPPDALLKHIGCWQFEPGELERLLGDIEQLRDLEE